MSSFVSTYGSSANSAESTAVGMYSAARQREERCVRDYHIYHFGTDSAQTNDL